LLLRLSAPALAMLVDPPVDLVAPEAPRATEFVARQHAGDRLVVTQFSWTPRNVATWRADIMLSIVSPPSPSSSVAVGSAGLTQGELSERTGRDRSVIARWEQGLVSPPVESLVACLHACGFDLPFVLVPLDDRADKQLRESLMLPPSERVKRMLDELGQKRGRKGS